MRKGKIRVLIAVLTLITFLQIELLPLWATPTQLEAMELILEGKILYRLGRYVEAINKLQRGLAVAKGRKERFEAYLYLALSHYALGEEEEARGYIVKVMGIKSDLPEEIIPEGFMKLVREVEAERVKERVVKVKEVEKKKRGGGSWLGKVVLGVVLAGGGAAAWYFLSKKKAGAAGPEIKVGSIQVNSEPTGAKVYLDGQDTGKRTNCLLGEVSPGVHRVKLAKEGYVDVEKEVNVSAGQTAVVDVKLGSYKIEVKSPKKGDAWVVGEEVEIKWETSETVVQRMKILPLSRAEVRLLRRSRLEARRFEVRGARIRALREQGFLGRRLSDGEIRVLAREANEVRQRPKFVAQAGRGQVERLKVEGLSKVKIELYRGDDKVKTIVESTENDGSYKWKVSAGLEEGSDYRVRVYCYGESSVYGESQEFDIIQAPYLFVLKIGKGPGKYNFRYPRGIAVDAAGNVYVADTWNHRIMKFSSNGKFITKWGSYGKEGNYQFYGPNGIAVDAAGNVYVADTYNHRIMKFSSDGKFIKKWGSNGSKNNQFKYPSGIAVDGAGNVYVADTENHRIMKFSSNGKFITKWGSYGKGAYHFNNPFGIAVDTAGNVYVADTYNHRIMKFSSNGKFITKWGSSGSGDYQFYSPSGIVVDAAGNVYVADASNCRIMKFDSDGKFITKWGNRGSGNYQFDYPQGIAVDAAGNVYVADTWNYRIMKFSSNGKFITKWGSRGSGNYQFDYPCGIAVDASGNVYVADTHNDRIMKYAPIKK